MPRFGGGLGRRHAAHTVHDAVANGNAASTSNDNLVTCEFEPLFDDAAVEQAASAPTYLPWRSLPSQTLGNCLRNEHPQVIAVVLTQLPPTQAAGVLAVLPAALQTDVLQRITRAPHPAPELLGDIVEVIEARLPWIEGLQATPAEGTTYRFAKADRKKFPNILQAGSAEQPYYTNSSQLPVGYTDDPKAS